MGTDGGAPGGGVASTVAGTGTSSYSGDGGAATSATFQYPTGLYVDASSNVYICDNSNQRVRFVNASNGQISTLAGTGTASFTGDGAAATSATFNYPTDVLVDGSNRIVVSDTSNFRLRRIASGTISTMAGNGS